MMTDIAALRALLHSGQHGSRLCVQDAIITASRAVLAEAAARGQEGNNVSTIFLTPQKWSRHTTPARGASSKDAHHGAE